MADDQAGDPAQAFEDLRAEVSVLRRTVESLPAAIRANRPADYSQDLGVIGKGLDELHGQLERMLTSPALSRTPEQQGHAIAAAGNTLIREAAQRLDRAAQETDRERARLSGIIGQAWAQDRQYKLLCWTAGVALAVGLLVSPFLASVLPFGLNTRVAVLVMRTDRWTAGGALMRAADPQKWNGLLASAAFVQDNQAAMAACQKAQPHPGKGRHCLLDLSSLGTAEPR